MIDPLPVIQHFTYVGIFCLLILGGLGFPFPEDGVLIMSGLLISHGVIKLIPALVVIYPSLLIADFILYSFGRKYGKTVFEHKMFSLGGTLLDSGHPYFLFLGLLVYRG